MYNLTFHVTHILMLLLKRSGRQVLMWDFGKLAMGFKITSCSCES